MNEIIETKYCVDCEKIKITLDILHKKAKEYSTVKKMQMQYGHKYNQRALKSVMDDIMDDYDFDLRIKVFDSNYGSIWAWHKILWDIAFNLEI